MKTVQRYSNLSYLVNVVEIKSIRGCTASEALCPFLLKINHMYSSLNYLLTKKVS